MVSAIRSPKQVTVTAAGVATLLLVPFGVSTAWVNQSTHHFARACCYYRPVNLEHGQVWKLIGSGVLLINPHPFGPTALFTMLVFLPYGLVRGVARAGVTFLAGHLTATLIIAAVALGGAAVHVASAVRLAHQSDVGMSAGLAAVTGALVVALARSRRAVALLPAAALTMLVGAGLAQHHALVESEHLIAFGTGALLEAKAQMSRLATPDPHCVP